MIMTKKEILELTAEGHGYGDPDARLIDDRKFQIFLAQEQAKIGRTLNRLTIGLIIVGLLNAAVLAFQVWSKCP